MKTPFLPVIKNFNFVKLWLAQITSQIALNMLTFVLTIRVYQETSSNTFVSLLLFVFALPSLFFGVAAGSLVDYFDKRKVLLFCNLGRLLLFLFFYFFSGNLLMIFVLTTVLSLITQFFIPAEAPSIAVLVEKNLLLSANSLFTITFYLSTIVGFVFSGPMVKVFGRDNVYWLMVILMAFASLFVYFLPHIQSKHEGRKEVFNPFFVLKTIKEGICFIKSNWRVEQSILLLTFSQALIAILGVLAPGFADRILAIELSDASYLIMGPAALGLILGALAVGFLGLKFLKSTLIFTGIMGIGITLFFLSLISRVQHEPTFWMINLILAVFLLFLLGFFNSLITVPANAVLQENSGFSYRGRVYGVLTSATGAVSLVPVVFSGVIADVFGVNRTLTMISLFVLIGGVWHYWQRKKQNFKL